MGAASPVLAPFWPKPVGAGVRRRLRAKRQSAVPHLDKFTVCTARHGSKRSRKKNRWARPWCNCGTVVLDQDCSVLLWRLMTKRCGSIGPPDLGFLSQQARFPNETHLASSTFRAVTSAFLN